MSRSDARNTRTIARKIATKGHQAALPFFNQEELPVLTRRRRHEIADGRWANTKVDAPLGIGFLAGRSARLRRQAEAHATVTPLEDLMKA